MHKNKKDLILCGSNSKSATYAGTYGDHIRTINSPEICKNAIFPSFNQSVKKTGKDLLKIDKMVEVFCISLTKGEILSRLENLATPDFLCLRLL